MIYLFFGICIGYSYGLFFVHQRRRVFSLSLDGASKRQNLYIVSALCMRIALLVGAYYYLLLTDKIRFILTMVSFISGFWIAVLTGKAKTDGRF